MKSMKHRLIWSIVFLIPVMYIAMHHMFYEWFGIPVPEGFQYVFHGDENAITFAFTQFLLILPIMYLNRIISTASATSSRAPRTWTAWSAWVPWQLPCTASSPFSA